jgi:S1-C subfamily serine protease
VVGESPAERAGLKGGDLVLRADAQALYGVDDLQRVLVLGGGPEVTLDVLRGRTRHRVRVRPALRAA